MADYDNTNSGVLFKNEDKEQAGANPNWPDHKGQAEFKCPHCNKNSEHWLSAWIKTSGPRAKNPGSRFFSLAFTAKEEKENKPISSKDLPSDDGFDDIPF